MRSFYSILSEPVSFIVSLTMASLEDNNGKPKSSDDQLAAHDTDGTNTSSWVLTGSEISTDGSWAVVSGNEEIEQDHDHDRAELPRPVSEAGRLSLDVAGAFGKTSLREWTAEVQEPELSPDPDTPIPEAEAGPSITRENKGRATHDDAQNQDMIRQDGGCVRCRANNLRVSNAHISPRSLSIISLYLPV